MIPKVISVGEHITLRLCQTEKFKAGMLSLSLVLPIARESTYLTSLLLSVLLRGTEKYPSISALNRRLDYLFGTELSIRNFYRGDAQIIGLSADLVDDAYLPEGDAGESLLRGALEVIAQILFHPVTDENGLLDARYVESEKQLQCDTIRAQKNHPHSYATDRCRAYMYENEPCGVPIYGTEEDVMCVTPELLTAHWKRICEGMHLHCFYVGGTDECTLRDALQDALAPTLDATVGRPLPSVIAQSSPDRCGMRYHEESLPVGQGQLVMGFRTGVTVRDADFYACTLFNELLGTSPISKLFMNVRERLSLCYSCNSVYNIYKGAITISCGLENGNREQAEAEVLRQIRAIADGEITDAEWFAAQKSLENAYRQLEDSPAALESFYFGRALVGEMETLADCRKRFGAVSRADVIDIARKLYCDTVFF
ncbi:MAG: insulinase family protein, partial [Clostridia bacterium]|nr:insulinase family protein [Clostridia bacterium]